MTTMSLDSRIKMEMAIIDNDYSTLSSSWRNKSLDFLSISAWGIREEDAEGLNEGIVNVFLCGPNKGQHLLEATLKELR